MGDRDDALPQAEWHALVATAEHEIEAILARLEVATRRPVRCMGIRVGLVRALPSHPYRRCVEIALVDKEVVAVEYGWRA